MLFAIDEAIHVVGVAIELMAVAVIAYAAAEAFVSFLRIAVTRVPIEDRRAPFMRFLRLLVVGLTFELAADLVHITIAHTWEQLGRVAVIAGLRTFLAFFLDRDLRTAGEWRDLT